MKRNDRLSLVIHLGMPKTGTTLLQNCLNLSGDLINNFGVMYPKAGRGNEVAHHKLAVDLASLEPSLIRKFSLKFLDNLSSEAEKKSDIKIAVISSEAFNNLISISKCEKLVEFLSCLADVHKFKAYLYVREFSEFIESMYLQSARSGHTVINFSDYFEQRKFWVKGYIEGIVSIRNQFPNEINVGFKTKDFDILNEFEKILSLRKLSLSAHYKDSYANKKLSLKEEILLSHQSDIESKVNFKISRQLLINYLRRNKLFETDIVNYSLFSKNEKKDAYLYFMEMAEELNFKGYINAFKNYECIEYPHYSINKNLIIKNDIKKIIQIRNYIELI